ncbi:MAG: YkgJ family cysteine cluster protein [Sulfuricella sp.]|nr:YkgJ family cysteine cluster protein [Sulfuricella sp.]
MIAESNADDAGASPAISCSSCKAYCCRLEVMLMGDDDIPPELTERDRWGGWVMARLDDGWCAALDRDTMLCTIYERRPMICSDYQVGDSDCIGERLLLAPARVESQGASR